MLILVPGVLLMVGGFDIAKSGNSVTTVALRNIWVSPLMLRGILEMLVGVATTASGYLLCHGKIGYFNST
jgi:hypothetical protein